MVTRKEVKTILAQFGLNNKFTLRTMGFSDLARCSVQVVSIENSLISPLTNELVQSIKSEFKPLHCIVEVKGWPSSSWC